MLGKVAGRFLGCLRPSDSLTREVPDGLHDAVARLDGDEFTVMLRDLGGRKAASMVAQRLLDSLREPIGMDGHDVYVNASIGIAVAPDDGRDAEALLKNADVAMFVAKRGGGGYAFFEEAMSYHLARRLTIGSRLRKAIDHDELELVYQPIVRMDGSVSKIEALLRFPVTTLKIERTFVTALDDPDSTKLCEAVIALGRSFGVSVVAEGVETFEQADTLLALGCQSMQGYLYSRPLAAPQVVAFVRSAARPRRASEVG